MIYTNADFVRMISAVDAQGGELLDETCAKEEVIYEIPGRKKPVVDYTHGCENETLFRIPYEADATVMVPEPVLEEDPDRSGWTDLQGNDRRTTRSVKDEDEDGNEVVVFEMVERESPYEGGGVIEKGTVRVCALADNVGMWPRFAGVCQDKGSK